jgi:predicted transposase YbfD/YdcC
MEYLDQVADHRSRRGLRYELGFLLAVVVAATACAGHDEVAAQAQWAADAPEWVLIALGAKADPLTGRVAAPSESTLRRALRDVDAEDLQRLTARWAAAAMAARRDRRVEERPPAVAIDGKSVRGAAAGGGPRPHLLGAAAHDGGIVLAQHQIPDKSSEITELKTLVTRLDLGGAVVTVDALHTQHKTAAHLVEVIGAEYLMTIKANQPTLLAAAARILSGPAADVAGEHTERSRGHGRTEQRILRTMPVTLDSPSTSLTQHRFFALSATSATSTGNATPKKSPTASPVSPQAKLEPTTSARTCADTGAPSKTGSTGSATSHSMKTHPPSAPVPHPKPWPSSETP